MPRDLGKRGRGREGNGGQSGFPVLAFKSSLHTGHPGMWKLWLPKLDLVRKEEPRTPACLSLSPGSGRTKVGVHRAEAMG